MAILAGTLALAGLLPATVNAGSGLAPTQQQLATTSLEVETLASYVTKGKIKAERRVRFLGVCSTDCAVTASMTLAWPGPNLVTSDSGTFPAGQVFEGFIKLTKAGHGYLKENKGKSKLVTKIQAVDTLTGDTDTDKRNFKFK